MTWFYFYVPAHVAGSGGNGYIGKLQTTEAEIRASFRAVLIDGQKVLVCRP